MRITDKFLEARIETINGMLGLEDVQYLTVGAVRLYGAYGSTGVHRVVNEHEGVTELCPLGTKREVAAFLGGMIQALRIVNES